MRTLLRIGVVAVLTVPCVVGDVTFDQSMRYTGGSLLDMIRSMAGNPLIGRLAGGNLNSAFQDQNFKVYVKGAKMARMGGTLSTIYDLDAGTITLINNEKRSYMVRTFDEVRQEMERAQQRLNRNKAGDFDFTTKVEKTGQTRTIDGQTATETRATMTAKSAGANGQMVVNAVYWLAPFEPATRELLDYSKRLHQKFNYAFMGSPALGAAAAGINAAMEEGTTFDGYPVLADTEVSGIAAAGPFARGNGDSSAPLIKVETHSSNFIQGPVDDSNLSVPAGYKQEAGRH
jgi:hypothetical protein